MISGQRGQTTKPRRHFIAGLGVASAGFGVVKYPAGAAEFTYKLSLTLPADSHSAVHLLSAAAKIRQESGGRMEIQVFPNSVLGGNAPVFAQLRLGAVQFQLLGDPGISSVVPVAGITAVPFAFPDHNALFAMLNGPLGRFRRDAFTKANLYAFETTWPDGFRQVVNRLRPIVVLSDFKGIKIRVDQAPILTGLFKALGAVPTTVTSNEIYPALQTHVVDGVDLPLDFVEAWKLYELAKYFSYTNHVYQNQTLMCNGDAWQQLPESIRLIVDRNFNAAALSNRKDVLKEESSMESELKGQGMFFNRPSISLHEYQGVVRASGLYASLRDLYGAEAWGLLENAAGRLT